MSDPAHERTPDASPRPSPASAPKPASRPDGAVPGGADSYTSLPQAAPRRRWGVWAAAVLALALAGGWAARTGRAPAPGAGAGEAAAGAAVAVRALTVTSADIDRAGTAALRASPEIKTEAAAPLAAPAPVQARKPGVPLPSEPAAAAAAVPAPVAEAVRGGGYELFQLKIIDSEALDGDVVGVSVDGVPMGQFMLTPGGAVLDVPLKPGKRQVVRITAVKDGWGGITLGVRSSAGHVTTSWLMPGQYEEWVVDYR